MPNAVMLCFGSPLQSLFIEYGILYVYLIITWRVQEISLFHSDLDCRRLLCTVWYTARMDLVIPVSAPLSTLEDHYSSPENQHKADQEERITVWVESQDEIK